MQRVLKLMNRLGTVDLPLKIRLLQQYRTLMKCVIALPDTFLQERSRALIRDHFQKYIADDLDLSPMNGNSRRTLSWPIVPFDS